MSPWYVPSVFVHVISAAFWIGGMLFLPLILLPGIKTHPDRVTLLLETGIRFRYYGWIALVLLAITGILNMHFKGLPFTWEFIHDSSYGNLLGSKVIIFIVMLLIASIHDFYIGERAIEQMQRTNNGNFKYIAR